MSIPEIQSTQEFNDAINSEGLVVVDFHAVWCGPCKAISPALSKFAEEYPNVKFIKVDVDALSEVATQVGITAMPTVKYYKAGKLVDEFIGANIGAIQSKIVSHA
ncbi:Thioredoxin [Smittium mucronatum]|uniref:Thioredoxin n=1 Tax=Smittium mucronatum TaxID=133383 RepID=A0A1R0GUQ7_9FUNG|nr:Thioredoxin [Smittium mucronatum]